MKTESEFSIHTKHPFFTLCEFIGTHRNKQGKEMEKFFKLKKYGTNVPTEIIAGVTTFFAMSYIIALNPSVLGQAGMEWGAVFIATIISAIIGTLIMGLVANVPYAQAPGVGMNAFFTFTVVKVLGFNWRQALSMVFICGIINILITVTRIRKLLILAITETLQAAISGGIGIFIAYVGMLDVKGLTFASGSPSIARFNNPVLLLFLIGLLITVFFQIFKFPGKWAFFNRAGFFFSIIITALIGIPMGVTTMAKSVNIGQAFGQLPSTLGVIFTSKGIPALFAKPAQLPLVLVTILAFSLSDIFDTIGTFVGTGRSTGIFSDADMEALRNSKGFGSRMDRALFADSTATSIGAIFGTSNTTTYLESAAGIAAGGRTGLTSVVVAILFAISLVAAPLVSAIPAAATAPVLVLVGCMMMSSFKDIKWDDLSVAIPAFAASVFMALSYSISNGIAAGFIAYALVKTIQGKAKDVHWIIWVVSALFILDYAMQATVL